MLPFLHIKHSVLLYLVMYRFKTKCKQHLQFCWEPQRVIVYVLECNSVCVSANIIVLERWEKETRIKREMIIWWWCSLRYIYKNDTKSPGSFLKCSESWEFGICPSRMVSTQMRVRKCRFCSLLCGCYTQESPCYLNSIFFCINREWYFFFFSVASPCSI